MKKLKKVIVLMSIVATLMASTHVAYASEKTQDTNAGETEVTTGQIVELTGAGFLDKISEKDDFYVLVGRPNCPACQRFDPTIRAYMETSTKTLFHYNTLQSDSKAVEAKAFMKQNGLKYIPAIFHFANGELVRQYEVFYGEEFEQFKTDFEQE